LVRDELINLGQVDIPDEDGVVEAGFAARANL
jgi:hypothetical protein